MLFMRRPWLLGQHFCRGLRLSPNFLKTKGLWTSILGYPRTGNYVSSGTGRGGINTFAWFPITYIYGNEFANPWYRFISASYCKKAMVAFGCDNIQDMVKLLSENPIDDNYRYRNSFHSVKGVAQWFKPEEIGSKP